MQERYRSYGVVQLVTRTLTAMGVQLPHRVDSVWAQLHSLRTTLAIPSYPHCLPYPRCPSGSQADDIAAGYEADSDGDLSTDAEDDRLFIRRLAALQDRINYLSNTRVLFPNRVHKLSQLYLVLVLYKEDDHKRFRQNSGSVSILGDIRCARQKD